MRAASGLLVSAGLARALGAARRLAHRHRRGRLRLAATTVRLVLLHSHRKSLPESCVRCTESGQEVNISFFVKLKTSTADDLACHRRVLDVLAAPQYPVIGETSNALSSVACCEYGASLAAATIECREIAALARDISVTAARRAFPCCGRKEATACDLLGCGMQTLALRR